MPEDSSPKYYRNKKEKLQKKSLGKIPRSFQRKKNKKKPKKNNNKMGENYIKVSLKIKSKGWLRLEKNVTR